MLKAAGRYLVNVHDSVALLRQLTLIKIANATLLLLSYFFARITRKPVHWGMPMSVAIEPTTACNLRCPECPSGLRSFSRPTGMLNEPIFRAFIDAVHSRLVYLTFYFQGEPYLHPNFLNMVQYAVRSGVYTATSTNAHYLDDAKARMTVESGLHRLIISLDGTTQEIYSQYRVGGQLNKVLEGTKRVLAWRNKLKSSTPMVVFQFLVVKPNEHQMHDARRLANEIGVDAIVFKTAQVYNYTHGNPLIPTNTSFSRYAQNSDGTWRIKHSLLNQCWKMWHSCVVTWDGKVVPCCFDKDAHHSMGTVGKEAFRSIWKSQAYRSFRASLLRSRSEIDMCKNCSEGGVVLA